METKNIKIKKGTALNFFLFIGYKIVLDLAYYFIISPLWGYKGLEFRPNLAKLIESYFLLYITFVLMPKSPKKLSNVMVWLLILLSYIPILTLFAFMDQTRSFMYAVTGFWLLVFLLLKIPRTHIPSIKKSQSKIISYSVFIFLGIAVLFLIYKYLGFTFNFDLTKVYEIRKVYTEMKIPLAGYLFNWQAYIIIPVFFALFLIKRKWIPIILIVLLQIFLFSSTGNKTFLFAIPFVLVLMWIVTRKNPIALMSIGLIGIILLGMLSYYTIDDVWVSSLFARRTLLTPAQVSFFYYDFFSKNGPTFLSQHHLFRNFIDYPYHLNPPRLIASVYFDKPDMNANNGIYADAFMNFGFWGFILWGVLLTVILKSIDSFSKNKDLKITIATIAIPTIFLTNSALLTCFLTHGLLLSLLLLYLLPKESKTQKI